MDIVIEGLTKAYGHQKAVDNISFEVRTGEIVGFLGPNGAGKTTTMKMITQFLSPDQGQIIIGGKTIARENLRGSIGYLPENNPLYDDMPVMDYLAFCGQLQGIKRENLEQRVREMIVMCGLQDEKHKKIGELSKGYRQRVGLAQAMIHDPAILILDEATSALDTESERIVQLALANLMKNRTTLVIAHRLSTIQNADRIVVLDRGTIVEMGSHDELLSRGGVYRRLHAMQFQDVTSV